MNALDALGRSAHAALLVVACIVAACVAAGVCYALLWVVTV